IRSIRAAYGAEMPKARGAGEVEQPPASLVRSIKTTDKVIALGASTGGTKALELVMSLMPPTAPATVIVQHMPLGFMTAFAKRLNEVSPMEVREAVDGDDLVPGLALIAPAQTHMLVQRSGTRYTARLKDGPRVHYQKPSVDVLFQSLATSAGPN